jgi:molybdopterin-synthase adenylyltransferase
VALREDQIRRYARHVLLPDVGGVGQERLLAAAVRVDVGPGRDAEVAALIYLAAAGVGTLALAGDATGAVTPAEVAGGIGYGADDVGRARGDALAARIAAINPDVRVAAADGVAGAVALVVEPGEPGLAGALVRGGAAATVLLHRIATA